MLIYIYPLIYRFHGKRTPSYEMVFINCIAKLDMAISQQNIMILKTCLNMAMVCHGHFGARLISFNEKTLRFHVMLQ